jgi:hypothetical protein
MQPNENRDLVVVPADRVLAMLGRAAGLLAEVVDVQGAKRAADAAHAAGVYARRQKLSEDVIRYATAVTLARANLSEDSRRRIAGRLRSSRLWVED